MEDAGWPWAAEGVADRAGVERVGKAVVSQQRL